MKKFTKFFGPVMMLLLLPAAMIQAQTTYTVSGYVYYDCNPVKPMPFTEVFLIGTNFYDIADGNGYYEITDVPNGTYYIAGESCTGWCGLDSDDITQVTRMLIGSSHNILTDLRKRAADGNQSGTIQTTDALRMQQRLYNSFLSPSWIDPYEMVWDGPFVPGWPGTGKSITVAGAGITHDVCCLFTGDVNGSGYPGFKLKDVRDNRTYPTIQIDRQCWMRRNLNIGDTINSYTGGDLGNGDQTNNEIIEKYCYNNALANCVVYGGLYQWDEAMDYNPSSPGPVVVQGICPAGWHLPTDDEWCTLERFIDPTILCDRTWFSGDAGGKLKETGTSHWQTPNLGATNTYNFTAFGGGVWYDSDENNSFGDLRIFGFFWSSVEHPAPNTNWGMNRALYYNYASIRRAGDSKTRGYSVRCLKD